MDEQLIRLITNVVESVASNGGADNPAFRDIHPAIDDLAGYMDDYGDQPGDQ